MGDYLMSLIPTQLFGGFPSAKKRTPMPRRRYCAFGVFVLGCAIIGAYVGGPKIDKLAAWEDATIFSPKLMTEEELAAANKIQAPQFPPYSPLQTEASRLARLMLARNGRSARQKFTGPHLILRSKGAQIPPGSMVQATLISGASNGPVKAALAEDLLVDGESVLPEGTILLGSGTSTEERLFVRFSKIVYRDGKFESIQAEAADLGDKIAGLKGSKIGRYATKLAAGIGLNFVAGMSEALQEQHAMGPMGMPVKDTSMRNALLNGTQKASMEQAQDVMGNMKDQQPIIEVRAGTRIYVLFSESG